MKAPTRCALKQIEANRRNALKSTGPRTDESKHTSSRNAIRHGLTAETVLEPLEDPEDYKTFEGAVAADYDAQSAVERELALRLSSLLWRLRRATLFETSLMTDEWQIPCNGEHSLRRPTAAGDSSLTTPFGFVRRAPNQQDGNFYNERGRGHLRATRVPM